VRGCGCSLGLFILFFICGCADCHLRLTHPPISVLFTGFSFISYGFLRSILAVLRRRCLISGVLVTLPPTQRHLTIPLLFVSGCGLRPILPPHFPGPRFEHFLFGLKSKNKKIFGFRSFVLTSKYLFRCEPAPSSERRCAVPVFPVRKARPVVLGGASLL